MPCPIKTTKTVKPDDVTRAVGMLIGFFVFPFQGFIYTSLRAEAVR